jgi:hypothetical protein
MREEDLTETEICVLCECLKAAAYGPFFVDKKADDPYWEVHSLFGISMDELRQLADSCPNIDMSDETVKTAITNTFNNLLRYPHGFSEKTWSQYISVSSETVIQLFGRWVAHCSKT